MDTQSQLLRINSKFRNDPLNSSTSNFTYSIASTSATESVTKLELISFNMNRNGYNVASYNNQLMIKDGFSNVTTVSLTVGHYTIESLVVELNRVCNFTESEVQVILTWSIVNDRLQVVGNNVFIISVNSTIAPYIGLVGTDLVTSTTPVILPSVPQLQGPDPIYIQSFTICSGGCLDSTILGGLIPLVGVIPCNQIPYGFNISWVKQAPDSYYTQWNQPISIRTIDITLTDMYGNVLELPGSNVDVDLVFRIYY